MFRASDTKMLRWLLFNVFGSKWQYINMII